LPGTSISHLRVAGFEEGTAKELRNALTEIQKNRFTPIILDLRNNPGGILDEAVSVTSQFLGTGNALLVKDAKGGLKPVPVTPGGVATNVPLAVLINEGTASGAEIVAGAIRDAKRATLIGNTTFGTGTVLQEFPLSDGSALLLAVQEWLTPSGQSFWHKGIASNVPVSLAPEADILVPESEQGLTPAQLRSSGDAQLLRALELLITGQEHKEAAALLK
jgi:carboxyl-terminal processing protease